MAIIHVDCYEIVATGAGNGSGQLFENGPDVLGLDQQLRRVCQSHHLLVLSLRAGGAEHPVESQSQRRRRRLHEGGHLKIDSSLPGALHYQHLLRSVAAVDGKPQVGLMVGVESGGKVHNAVALDVERHRPFRDLDLMLHQPEPHLTGGEAIARAGIAANEKLLVFRVDKEYATGADGIASQINHPAERLSAGRAVDGSACQSM